jgi:hypothetical protein
MKVNTQASGRDGIGVTSIGVLAGKVQTQPELILVVRMSNEGSSRTRSIAIVL